MATSVVVTLQGPSGATIYGGRFGPGGGAYGTVALDSVGVTGQAGGQQPPPSPPTTITQSGASSGTVNVPVTVTWTINAAADQTYTITPAATNGATLGHPTRQILAGQTQVSTTVNLPAAGPTSVTFSCSPALSELGEPLSITFSDPVAGGTWQQLSVAPHSRRHFYAVTGNIGTGTTFDPTVANTVDGIAPITVNSIPYKSFARPIMGEPGVLYYMGGLHSNYFGNEIDRIDLRNLASSQITTTLNQQPRVPPQGAASGYGSGISGYVYRQYGTALTDTSLWEPYSHHTWTFNGWHPTWGYLTQVPGAQGDGATVGANPLGAGTQYQQPTNGSGLLSYEWTAARWRLRIGPAVYADFDEPNGPGPSGLSDWNQHRMSMVFMNNRSGNTFVRELVNTSTTPIESFNFNQATLGGTIWGWADRQSGNGILIKWMEASKYLCMRADFNKNAADPNSSYTTIFLMNFADPTKVRKLTPPAGETSDVEWQGDGNITFAVDRSGRRVFWWLIKGGATSPQFQRFYVSDFDDLMAWTPITTTGLPTITTANYANTPFADKRERMWYYNGHLFIALPGTGGGPNDAGYQNGAVNWWRVKVDQGEALPAMTFNRYDYNAQNFQFSDTAVAIKQLIGTKHVNWAYRPSNDTWYQCAGDFGASFCHSMAKLQFDGTSRGYTFTEVLDELTNPPAGRKRPGSPDDGYWVYLGDSNPNAALAGKFLFARGGDGTGVLSNVQIRAKYGNDENDPANIAAARADGWDNDKLMLFHPDGAEGTPPRPFFTTLNAETFTQILGGNVVYDTGHMGDKDGYTSSRTRCGIYDHSTNTLFRFVDQGGLHIAAWNLTTQQVRLYVFGTWTDTTGMVGPAGRIWYTGGARPASSAAVTANGFGFYDSGADRYYTDLKFEWEHKAMWLDQTNGKLYCVSPLSGYLWCFETRNPTTDSSSRATLVFYPVGQRIPVNAKTLYTGLRSFDSYPPYRVASDSQADARMGSFLMPFKGGLLWWSGSYFTSGVSGVPTYCYWRRLDNTGPWSAVTLPQEFAANAPAAKDPTSINNSEILAISQAFTDIEDRQFYRYFWRIT